MKFHKQCNLTVGSGSGHQAINGPLITNAHFVLTIVQCYFKAGKIHSMVLKYMKFILNSLYSIIISLYLLICKVFYVQTGINGSYSAI